MKGIINNVINSYEMQAKALSILVTNTQKALEQSEKEGKANEQIQRVENFVKDLTMDLNNMLTKFYFLKERKNRRRERMTDRQVKAITEFSVFIKVLTKNVCSLLKRFQAGQSFEEKIDKEIRELEAGIGQKLREFDKALDESNDTLTIRLIKFVQNITGSFARLIQVQRIFLAVANRRKSDKLLKKSTQNIKEDSPAHIQDTSDNELENLFNCPSLKSVKSDEKSSKCLMHLKA